MEFVLDLVRFSEICEWTTHNLCVLCACCVQRTGHRF